MNLRISYKLASVTCCALLLAACAGKPRLGGDPQLSVLPGTELPVPERPDANGGASPYYVGAFDKLTVGVFGIEEMADRDVQVDASGRLSFPLAGVVDVAGKTPREIETELSTRLRAAGVRDPQVTVNVKEVVSRVVTVEGEVKKPGIYPVVGRMTLVRAVAKAESTTEFSKLDEVVVYRTVQNQRYAALYNLDAIRHGAYPDPEIYPGDVVMVGDESSRHLFRDIVGLLPALTTPIIVALQRF